MGSYGGSKKVDGIIWDMSLKFSCDPPLINTLKVTGDSLHQENFASNKLFVSPQGKQL